MLLRRLTEASGVSGNEDEVRNIIISELDAYVDSIKIDKIGNILVHKKSNKKSNKKIMLAAHMDEVGLIVRDIDNNGLLKFSPVGGIDQRVLVSKVVRVGKNNIKGVIGAKPIHLQEPGEREKALSIDNLYIDVGAKSKKDIENLISIGDYVVFDSNYREFGNGLIKAKALDDRVGCSILIDIFKNIDANIYGAFTVMEEVGLRGAGPAAYEIDPDIAIIVEGTLCYEEDGLDSHLKPTELGKGPAISLIDRTSIYNEDFRKKIINIAEKNNLNYQYRKSAAGGNDSGKIHISRDGVLTSTISVPCRNIHAPNSVMSKEDYKNTLKLISLIIMEIEKGEF